MRYLQYYTLLFVTTYVTSADIGFLYGIHYGELYMQYLGINDTSSSNADGFATEDLSYSDTQKGVLSNWNVLKVTTPNMLKGDFGFAANRWFADMSHFWLGGFCSIGYSVQSLQHESKFQPNTIQVDSKNNSSENKYTDFMQLNINNYGPYLSLSCNIGRAIGQIIPYVGVGLHMSYYSFQVDSQQKIDILPIYPIFFTGRLGIQLRLRRVLLDVHYVTGVSKDYNLGLNDDRGYEIQAGDNEENQVISHVHEDKQFNDNDPNQYANTFRSMRWKMRPSCSKIIFAIMLNTA